MPHHPAHLVFISADNALPNQLISSLRQHKLPLKASRLYKLEEFNTCLNQTQPGLLLLLESESINALQWLDVYSSSSLNIPLLVASSENSSLNKADCLEKGACDVIPQQDIERLFMSIKQQLSLAREINRCRKLSSQITELEKQQQQLLDSSASAIAIIDKDRHRYCNSRYAAIFARQDCHHIVNTSILDLVSSDQKDKLKNIILARLAARDDFILNHDSTGESKTLTLSFIPAFFKGDPCLQVTASPAKGNSQYSREKNALAEQDLLTRLDNLQNFTDTVESAIAQALSNQVISTLLIVSIEHFNKVRESLGKAGTNQVLYEISEFLKSVISKSFTASRLAENEFGLLLYDCDHAQACKLAEYIHAKLNSTVCGEQSNPTAIDASLGLTVINELSLDAEDMINCARINKVIDGLPKPADDLDRKIPDLVREALTNNRLQLLFQALVPFHPDDNLERYEVCTRLQDGNNAYIPASGFLPHANIHNLAAELDKQVITRIFQQHLKDDKGPKENHLYIHISSNSLVNKSMLPWLSKALQDYRVPAHKLVFQISEIDIHRNWQQVLNFCQNLDDLGIRTLITCFGGAMEPLPVLEAVKPHAVRLDQNLVKDIFYSHQQQNTVRKLVRAIHHKEIKVYVNGIEEIDALPLLWDLGVDIIQGCSIHPPALQRCSVFPGSEIIRL